jgi:hypothetical protein
MLRRLQQRGLALASAASAACNSTSNGFGSIWYSGSPDFTSALLERARQDDPGDARRTSAIRSGAMRPGNSRTMACGAAFTVTTLTSGGSGGLHRSDALSLQPDSRTAAPNRSAIELIPEVTACERASISHPSRFYTTGSQNERDCPLHTTLFAILAR